MGAVRKTWLWWSSGKDSTWALHRLLTDANYHVDALVTTFNVSVDRVAMHAVRSELVRAQAAALGIELQVVEIPHPCPNGVYEEEAGKLIQLAEDRGVTHMAFGDLFLEDVRAYREKLLESSNIEPVFPLWGLDTSELAATMIDAGVRACLTCVDPRVLEASFAGRAYDRNLLADLPASVDPCGENGEFHTFVYDAPDFATPIQVKTGEVVTREGFVFADVLPVG